MFTMTLLTALYVQNIIGFSPLRAAISFIPFVFAMAIGAVITVADNGLGYTATAEIAGSAWAGRARARRREFTRALRRFFTR